MGRPRKNTTKPTAKQLKENKALAETLIFLTGIVAMAPFLVFSLMKWSSIKSEYMQNDSHRRVTDIKVLNYPIMKMGAFAFLWAGGAYYLYSNQQPVYAIILSVVLFYVFIRLAQWTAVKYMGAIIDGERDIIVFPHDMQSYGITDYLVSIRKRNVPDLLKI